MTSLSVTYRPLAELIPYVRNSRTHSDAQVAQIAASIREFGWTNPVLIDGEKNIIAGHGRVLAARKLGLTEIPTIEVGHMTPAQRRAYVIADNQLAANAGWDNELLKLELGELNQEGFDLSLIGFSLDELERLLAPAGTEGNTDPDEVPEVPEQPVTVQGDVWVLGQHRIMCGDSTSATDIEKLMQGQRADMLFTDPPWNVNYGAVQQGNPQGYKPRTILNDHMDKDKWASFVAGFCGSFYMATKPGALAYVVMSAQEWPSIDKGLRDAHFHWSSTIIWVKDSLVLSRKDYHTQYEPIWYGWNEDGPRIVQVPDRKQSDVWNVARPKVSELHPTTKPVELISRALLNSSARGAVVIDLFGGSGSTLIACEKEGRINRSMELDPKYADVIVLRWQEFTGKAAVLEGDGRTFTEVLAQRQPDKALVAAPAKPKKKRKETSNG
jgi:DNA modification methylase